MTRLKAVQILATVAVLILLGAWSYSSGSEPRHHGNSSSPTLPRSLTGTTDTQPVKSTGVAASLAPTTTVAANPDAYAAAAYHDWTVRDRDSAARIATPAAVTELFKPVWHKSGGWAEQGCTAAADLTVCTWARKHRQLRIQVRNASATLPVLVVAASIVVTK